MPACGEVPEWTIGTVSKTVVALWLPRVRIPPSPLKKKHPFGCFFGHMGEVAKNKSDVIEFG